MTRDLLPSSARALGSNQDPCMSELTLCSPFWRLCEQAGGFDEYILNTSDKNLASALGSELKREMKEALKATKEA